MNELAPQVKALLQDYKTTEANITANLDSVAERLSQLREKISIARDAANRVSCFLKKYFQIKLGAKFTGSGSIQLEIPQSVSQSAAHTDIAFFFRTAAPNGLALYFGNTVGSAGTRAVPTDDYIAVEVVNLQPRVLVDLGSGPAVVYLRT